MKFGKVDNVDEVDFSIPPDHPATDKVLKKSKTKDLKVYVGCGKWNKTDLKNFYPRGTKSELEYYATQFNSIELNATHKVPEWGGQAVRFALEEDAAIMPDGKWDWIDGRQTTFYLIK